MHEFIVESRAPSTEHRRNVFDARLRRPGGSPADVALKSRLKGLFATASPKLSIGLELAQCTPMLKPL
jgi:hypothetical protein